MFTSDGPLPALGVSPSPDAVPFWEAAERGELLLPYCPACARFFFYPRTACPTCGSRDTEWRPASGRGTLYTFCVQHVSPLPAFADAVPFVTAIVELDEGPRLMSFLVDVDVDVDAEPDAAGIRCGMPVEVTFTRDAENRTVPVFRPRP
ncbi:MAG TPA: Zn-ribbon domain-containing OB-fold protein [Mycobacteriales bacterium]|nr:Zn-ribbon domain-containing OB-fold protein [Mycobacteriales bacterium]